MPGCEVISLSLHEEAPPEKSGAFLFSADFSSEEADEGVEQGCGVRRTARDIEIGFENRINTAATLRVVPEESAGDGTGSAGDHKGGPGHGIIGLSKGGEHVSTYGTGYEDAVRMTGRSDKLDSETPHIPGERIENIEIEFAGGTASGGDLTDFQGFSAEVRNLTIRLELPDKRRGGGSDQRLPTERGEIVLFCECDSLPSHTSLKLSFLSSCLSLR